MEKTTKDQWNRRKVITAGLGFTGVGALLATSAQGKWFNWPTSNIGIANDMEPIEGETALDQYRGYSNGYELGQGKTDPLTYEDAMDVKDWKIDVDGKTLTLDQLRGRQYSDLKSEWFNLRCVEAWSMYVNYNGFPLSEIINEFGDPSKKYVAFTCVEQADLPGQNRRGFDWPYVEAYTMEEAMHDLTWAVFGNYGEPSVANGSPFRVNIPFKYGFKSPKWVVKIECTDTKPPATWNQISSREYGWFSSVIPTISHPRWRQDSERFISSSGTKRRPTKLFNGYADQVAHMYSGDLKQYR